MLAPRSGASALASSIILSLLSGIMDSSDAMDLFEIFGKPSPRKRVVGHTNGTDVEAVSRCLKEH